MANNPEVPDWKQIPFTQISSNLPSEFNDINIADAMDGCIDYLGAFNKQHLTMTFITKMGLWFTKAEENELKGNSNAERLKIAKEKLHLPEKLNLKFSEKGLSYHEMRAILILPKKQKYSDMTTEQLITLRNKVLLRFQREVDGHIYSWRKLQKQIEIVAKNKGINLPERKTRCSAAYDIEAAEDIVIPSFEKGMKATLVPTGLKAYMQEDEVLYLYAKSSGFGKKGIMLSNAVGIIDGDYYGNEDNDGHILFSVINLKEESYVTTVKLELPCDNIEERGTSSMEITDGFIVKKAKK